MKQHREYQSLSRVLFAGLLGLVGVTTLSAVYLVSVGNVLADTTSVSAVTTFVPTSCSFTSVRTGSYNATILNGRSTTITGDPVTTTCNDAAGYAVYAIGYSGDTYTGNYHTDMISTLNNSYNIKTNGTSGASYWKMKLQDLSNATIANSYNEFQAIPSDFTKVASYTSNTQAASFTPVYQIYIGTAQQAGTYTGKVKYTLVHPNTMVAGTYSIAYNANGGSGAMSNETGLYNFEGHTLPASTFTAPSGYAFAGWCTTNTAGSYACDGESYAAGDTLPASPSTSATSGGTMTLYAYWREPMTFDQAFAAAGKTKYNGGSYYAMQDASDSICAMVDDGQTGTLIDTRGTTPQTYSVGKLADGKCWMTENLNLAGGTALSADDTDVTSAYIDSFSTSNNLTKSGSTIVLPASSTSGFDTVNYSYVYNSGNTTNCGASGQNTPCYSYYSWDAATLGSGRSIATDNTDAPYSICPKGWRLPTSRTTSATNWQTTSDFYVLAHQYGLDSTTSTSESDDGFYTQAGPGTTPNFLLAGSYGNGSFNSGGSYGFCWSATSYSNSSRARSLYFNFNSNLSHVNSGYGSYRSNGSSVRCIFGE